MSPPLKKEWIIGNQIVNEEQVKAARAIGLTAEQVWVRVYKLKWSIERAISKPIHIKQIKKGKYEMDWNERISQLKNELMDMEKRARSNYEVIPDAIQLLINEKRRKIKRFELNAKNYWK